MLLIPVRPSCPSSRGMHGMPKVTYKGGRTALQPDGCEICVWEWQVGCCPQSPDPILPRPVGIQAQGASPRSPWASLGSRLARRRGRSRPPPPRGHTTSLASPNSRVICFFGLSQARPPTWPQRRASKRSCDIEHPRQPPSPRTLLGLRSPHPTLPFSHLHLCGGKMQHSQGACAVFGRGGGGGGGGCGGGSYL